MKVKIDKLKESFNGLTMTIGLQVQPHLMELLDKITPLIQQMTIWATANPKLVGDLATIATAVLLVGGFILFLGGAIVTATAFMKPWILLFRILILPLGLLIAFIGNIIFAIAAFAGGAATLGEALGFVIGPVGWIILAIIALIVITILIVTHWKQIQEVARTVWNNVKKFIGDAISAVIGWFKSVVATVVGAWNSVTTTIKNFVGGVIGAIVGFFDRVITTAERAWSEFARRPFYWLGFILGFLIGTFIKIAANIWGWWIKINQQAQQAVTQFVQTVVTWFQQLPGKVASFLLAVIVNVVTWAFNMKTRADKAVKDFVNAITDFLAKLPGRVWDFLTQSWQKLITWAGNMKTSAGNGARDFVKAIIDEAGKLPGQLETIGGDMIKGLIKGFGNMLGTAKKAITDFFGGLIDGARKAIKGESPSVLWAEKIGVPMAQGIGVGLRQGQPAILSAVQMVTNPGRFSGSTSNTSTTNAPNITININGAGDPRAVATQVRLELARAFPGH